MQKPNNHPISRRAFIRTSGAVAAGLATARLAPMQTLAVEGGPKTVTFSPQKFAALTRWPRYGNAEKNRLHELIDSNKFYDELPLFEKEWQDYTGAAFVNTTTGLWPA